MSSRPRRGPVPVADILGDVLRQSGLAERLAEREVLAAWPRIVGEKIARHSQAVDIKAGVLYLKADHGVWRQEITLLTPLIIEKFNADFGAATVSEIRWHRALSRGHRGDHPN
jgi:predicted nucleic acid-binding Zn ribbon protein